MRYLVDTPSLGMPHQDDLDPTRPSPLSPRIDAPCSSDRHVLQQSALSRGVIPTSQWSYRGCKKAADLQLQLLLAGLRCMGGRRGQYMHTTGVSSLRGVPSLPVTNPD